MGKRNMEKKAKMLENEEKRLAKLREKEEKRLAKLREEGITELRDVKEMTPELKKIIRTVTKKANMNDTWMREAKKAIKAGKKVVCTYNPNGNSKKKPMFVLQLDNTYWKYPF